jgi:DNA-binding NarL/FixJ family response regulator
VMTEAATGGPRIRVLIVAGNDPFRSGLVSLLAQEPDIEVIAESLSGRSGVQVASELRPDVVLVSIPLSDLKGSEATRQILQRSPTTRVLAFIIASNEDGPWNRDEIQHVIRAGASGFLARDTPIDQIVSAVRTVAADSRRLVHQTVEEVLAALHSADSSKHHAGADRLSPSELDVLRLISRGLDNQEIADAIGTNPRSVDQLASSILRRLGPPNR